MTHDNVPPLAPIPGSSPAPLPPDPHEKGEAVDDGRGRIFPCESCGADVEYNIGSNSLKCPYCGFVKEIELSPEAEIQEQDFEETLARIEAQHEDDRHDEEGQSEVRCESCGGTVVFVGTLTSSRCPYCATPIQRNRVHSATHRIPVDAVLPFLVNSAKARDNLGTWVKSRWFAPNAFLREGVSGTFNGVYLPYWTYDTLTLNAYSGQRGDAYYVTFGTGKDQRTERRVRWSAASGRFQRFFDDVTVPASRGLDSNYLVTLEPWPFQKMIPFTQQVLAGFMARTYDISLKEGFGLARGRIDNELRADVRRRIGGDEQRIMSIQTRYDAITFKHVLLPVWLLTYQYMNKPYRLYVNAATGEVQGDRPYSWIKITLAVICALIALGIVIALQRR